MHLTDVMRKLSLLVGYGRWDGLLTAVLAASALAGGASVRGVRLRGHQTRPFARRGTFWRKGIGLTPGVTPGFLAALGGWLLGLLLTPEVLAGGGPCGVVVVYDPTDPSAVTVANHYQQVRGIPERNMIPYVFPAAFSRRTGWDFIYGLRSELATRGLTDQLQAVALAGISPLLSGQTDGPQGNIFSTQSFLYQSPNYSEASFPEDIKRALNLAYPEDAEFYAPSPAGTRELSARTSFQGRRYLPCSYIGYTGKNGNRVSELFEILSRAKAHDGIKPRGTIYWPLNSDLRSSTREAQLDVVTPVWDARGIAYEVTGGRWDPDNAWVRNRPDILGGIVGQSNAGAPEGIRAGNTYRAGAWIDHLTSFGGLLDSYVIPLGQMSAAKWLRAGADGSAGAVAEPLGWPAKFPAAHLHTHLRAGASLAEAFWQSVRTTAEVACLGDPLLQPFADFPRVTVASPIDGARVTGSVAIVVRATPTGGKVLEPQCDLWVDGRRWANDGDPASAGASRIPDGFSLDTTAWSDGWHELRVVAYNHDGVRTQGEAKLAVTVNNRGQSLGLTGPSAVDPDGEATFILTPVGLEDLVSLVLRANGRTLATAPLAGGEVKVRLTDSGSFAPLGGNWSLFAMGTRANGQQVSSAPFTTAIAWPATAASSNPRLGVASAEVRYFASTATPGFHWDASAPDLVTTMPGDREQGIGLATNHVFGLVLDYAAKPGFQLDFWFYAPVEDLYEIGHDFCEPVWSNPTGTYTEQRVCFLDGRALVERDYVYPPRHLAPGWHSVRLRAAFNDPRWASWKARLRGGMNEDFGVFQPGWTANPGTGAPSSGPAFVSITPTNLVTGATRTLSARVPGRRVDCRSGLAHLPLDATGGPRARHVLPGRGGRHARHDSRVHGGRPLHHRPARGGPGQQYFGLRLTDRHANRRGRLAHHRIVVQCLAGTALRPVRVHARPVRQTDGSDGNRGRPAHLRLELDRPGRRVHALVRQRGVGAIPVPGRSEPGANGHRDGPGDQWPERLRLRDAHRPHQYRASAEG